MKRVALRLSIWLGVYFFSPPLVWFFLGAERNYHLPTVAAFSAFYEPAAWLYGKFLPYRALIDLECLALGLK